MIRDDGYEEIKESVIDTLGWSATGLCLAVINTLHEIDAWVYKWVNSDDPTDVTTHVHLYLAKEPTVFYPAMKSVLREYNLEYLDWEYGLIVTDPVPVHVPDRCKWHAILSFKSRHTNWTPNDPPPGGERTAHGWEYHPHPFPNATIHGVHRG